MLITEYDPQKLSKYVTNKTKYQPHQHTHQHIKQLLQNLVIEFVDFVDAHIMIYKICDNFVVIPEHSADPIVRIEVNYDPEYNVQFFNYIYTDRETTRVTSIPTKLNIFKKYELV